MMETEIKLLLTTTTVLLSPTNELMVYNYTINSKNLHFYLFFYLQIESFDVFRLQNYFFTFSNSYCSELN